MRILLIPQVTGFGHTIRLLRVARALKDVYKKSEITFLRKDLPPQLNPGVNTYSIITSIKDLSTFIDSYSPDICVGDGILTANTLLIAKILGKKTILLLDFLRKRIPKGENYSLFFRKACDQILICMPKIWVQIPIYMHNVPTKVHFVKPIISQELIKGRERKNDNDINITLIIDDDVLGHKILSSTQEALRNENYPNKLQCLWKTGGFLPKKTQNEAPNYMRNISEEAYADMVYSSEYIISTAGYNVLMESLYTHKKAILVCKNSPEQKFNAGIAKKFGLYTIEANKISSNSIKTGLLHCRGVDWDSKFLIKDIHFDSGESVAKHIYTSG